VLGTVLRDDRDASLHLHVSRVDDRIHQFFCLFILEFLFERFAAHFDGASPRQCMYCTLLFILDCMVMFLNLLLFFLFYGCTILFF
jgi:hypothetical protein